MILDAPARIHRATPLQSLRNQFPAAAERSPDQRPPPRPRPTAAPEPPRPRPAPNASPGRRPDRADQHLHPCRKDTKGDETSGLIHHHIAKAEWRRAVRSGTHLSCSASTSSRLRIQDFTRRAAFPRADLPGVGRTPIAGRTHQNDLVSSALLPLRPNLRHILDRIKSGIPVSLRSFHAFALSPVAPRDLSGIATGLSEKTTPSTARQTACSRHAPRHFSSRH